MRQAASDGAAGRSRLPALIWRVDLTRFPALRKRTAARRVAARPISVFVGLTVLMLLRGLIVTDPGPAAAAVSTAPVMQPDERPTARFPRKGFNFLIEDGYGTTLDTYRGLCTKDLVADPDTTIRLVLSPAEMDSIHAKMIVIGFFEMEEPHPSYGAAREFQSVSPGTTFRIEATAGTTTRRLSWDTGVRMSTPSAEWRGLDELVQLIRKTIENRPEFKALPAPNGLYE